MRTTTRCLLACALLLGLAGCEEENIQVGRSFQPEAPVAPVAPGAGPGEEAEGEEADAGPQLPQYRDEDFVEADSNRDPFHSYAAMFVSRSSETDRGSGRDVVMPETSIDEMRLLGIVSGVSNPRAMLADAEGVGYTVRRGDYIGRSEVVQAGGTESLPVTLNWRVDRIRPDSIILVREDPTAPNRPPLTRVIPLRSEDEQGARGELRTRGVTEPSAER